MSQLLTLSLHLRIEMSKKRTDPVFFGSQCGEKSPSIPSTTALSVVDVTDRRLFSLDAAVGFAKENNLLGVLLDAEALVCLISSTLAYLIINVTRFKYHR